MLQLPPEILDQIIEYLCFEDTRSISLVCSTLRWRAYRQLFKTIRISVLNGNILPRDVKLFLHHSHLLRYVSCLVIWPLIGRVNIVGAQVQRMPIHRRTPAIPVSFLWSQILTTRRFTSIKLYFARYDYDLVLQGLDPAENVDSGFQRELEDGMVASDGIVPVRSLDLPVAESGHRLVSQLLHRCSQSLVELRVTLRNTSTPNFPFLPHLRVFALYWTPPGLVDDLTPWVPFLNQHPSLTCVILDSCITSVPTTHLALLPNLQSLTAYPSIIEWLVPGRPVHDITIKYFERATSLDSISHSLPLSRVPVTTLFIRTRVFSAANLLVDMVHSLPMLRVFHLSTTHKVRAS